MVESGPARRGARKSELRKDTRFSVDEVIPLVYVKGLLTSIGIGRTNQAQEAMNLSEGGILVRTKQKLKSGMRVKVRLQIEKFKDVIEAEGKVRWCFQQAQDKSDYFAGIQFANLGPGVAAKISSLRGYFTSPLSLQRMAARRKGPANPQDADLEIRG